MSNHPLGRRPTPADPSRKYGPARKRSVHRYIAGDGFGFAATAQRALRPNPHGQRFFQLSLPPETAASTTTADRQRTRLRQRVLAAGGVLLACQRGLDRRRVDPTLLLREVVVMVVMVVDGR